jgi:D-alanyl-D-alanine carboxypeptidase (penicillin-binding protein 5/6)
MQIFVVSVKKLRRVAGLVIALGVIWLVCGLFDDYHRNVAGQYLIRRHYPPLVFLPPGRKTPSVCASAAILLEVRSGAVLFAKNSEIRRAPASTTKIMTAIVALEKGRLRQVVRVSRRAAATGGSTLWLQAGDRFILKELLEGMMLHSGNDGSMAVAEGVAGSIAHFVRLMNSKAKEIGALHTNFRNPHGLRAPSHYTTALDLALITRYGLADRRFAKLVKTKTASLEWYDSTKQATLRNTNRLLWSLEGVDGVKTGTTNEAGHCLVASATRDGKQLIAVALNSCNRWRDCVNLLEYGFANFTLLKIVDAKQPLARVWVQKRQLSLVLYPRHDLWTVVEKGTESLVRKKLTVYRDPVKPPLRWGQTLGQVHCRYQGQLIGEVDLINQVPVRRGWLWW